MYNVLDALLMLALMRVNHSDKKTIKKLTLKLAKAVPHPVKAGVIDRVLRGEKLSLLIDLHMEIVASSKLLSESGCHGMVVYGQDVYGVNVIYREEGDGEWAIKNEWNVALSSAHALMNALNLRLLECNVILFQHVGYTGSAHSLTIEPGVANKFARAIGDTQYFR